MDTSSSKQRRRKRRENSIVDFLPIQDLDHNEQYSFILRCGKAKWKFVYRHPPQRKTTLRYPNSDTNQESNGQQDMELKAALSAWLRSRSYIDQDQQQRGVEICGPSNVKISVQYTPPPRKRASRYLREKDRWEIITRIGSGEQQVALAKEFSVSRAAICNLYKNRQEILARAAADPHATYPKKTSTTKIIQAETSISSPTRTQINSTDGRRQCSPRMDENPSYIHDTIQETVITPSFNVHGAAAHSSPWPNLVATLLDERISSTVFQQRASPLARLIIEEAFAALPYENEEVTNQFGDICHAPKTLDERNICGVSMEGRGSVLLRAFSDISPMSPAGIVSLSREDTTNTESTPQVKAHLPAVRPGLVVMLLDIQCASEDEACSVLRHLVEDKQIPADRIYFVTIISSFEGLQKVSQQYPGVTLVTAQMDAVLDKDHRIRPGIGDFMQRFWNLDMEIVI